METVATNGMTTGIKTTSNGHTDTRPDGGADAEPADSEGGVAVALAEWR